MNSQIKIDEICDKNINFIVGSGASYGLFPTLQLSMHNDDSRRQHTIETLAEYFEQERKDDLKALLFMHYFRSCVYPVMHFDIDSIKSEDQKNVIEQYTRFLNTVLTILYKRRSPGRRCNIFTTNYDGCVVFSADILLRQGQYDFAINDGTRGFKKRYLQVKNFNSFIYQSGIFEQSFTDVPQINCIHLHGSVYWQKEMDKIIVDYKNINNFDEIEQKIKSLNALTQFNGIVNSTEAKLSDFDELDLSELTEDLKTDFWESYKRLPIVNPEKWKFHETVFEEHYYQMLRALSYELEKPNTVFISFGFSFADEHILNLVKRSLSNPTLQLFICCFNAQEFEVMKERFSGFNNVQLISLESNLDFELFNKTVLRLHNNELDGEI
ncbi:hypothetical protein E3983_10055 [Legionella israelensis]|uniref:SIR2-like domain-containing protein n=1 Tax=Legionella israelensis TaxID=454 RepID=A0AAX1EHX2_9GAMM|nr:hypothetical protein [Legionella israelensis]QBR84676.1 hypothetical protein E3983_10055 [Legionella israelensis]